MDMKQLENMLEAAAEYALSEDTADDMPRQIVTELIRTATRILPAQEVLNVLDERVTFLEESASFAWENASELEAEYKSGFRPDDIYRDRQSDAIHLDTLIKGYRDARNPYRNEPVESALADNFNLREVIVRVPDGSWMLGEAKYNDIDTLKLLLIQPNQPAAANIGDAVWAKRDLWYTVTNSEGESVRAVVFYQSKGKVVHCGITRDKRWYDVEFTGSDGATLVLQRLTVEFDFTTIEPKPFKMPF